MRNSKKIVLLLFSILVINVSFANDGIKFVQSDWETVRKEAEKTGKFIFIDFYADWCGPCKMMSRDVFTDPEVGKYFNKNFVSFKVDAENEEFELVELTGIEAYPTLVFYDPKGREMLRNVGALYADGLLEKAAQVVEYSGLEKRVNSGNYNASDLEGYLNILKNTDPEKAEVLALSWLGERKIDLTNTGHWSILSAAVLNPSEFYRDLILENVEHLYNNEENFVDYASTILDNMFDEAVTKKDLQLFGKAAKFENELLTHLGVSEHPYEYHYASKEYMYYYLTEDFSKYISSLDHFLMTFNAEDPEMLINKSLEVVEADDSSQELLITAKKWAEKAYSLENNFMTNIILSRLNYKTGEYRKALEYFTSARKFDESADYNDYLDNYERDLLAQL